MNLWVLLYIPAVYWIIMIVYSYGKEHFTILSHPSNNDYSQTPPDVQELLDSRGYIILNGVVTCNVCRSYCGQCGSRFLGMSVGDVVKELKS